MSERRRRKAKDEESDSESEASGENQHSDSESETGESANDEDETSPPNYEEAVKLESVITDSTAVGSKKTGSKTRGTESAPKKDPAFVPRSDRFFLHDNREGSGNGKTGSTGTGRNMRKSEPSSREPERTDRRYLLFATLLSSPFFCFLLYYQRTTDDRPKKSIRGNMINMKKLY